VITYSEEPIEEEDGNLAALLHDAVTALEALNTRLRQVPPPKGWTYSQIGHVEATHGLLRHKGGV
jgi:hypothetical protein